MKRPFSLLTAFVLITLLLAACAPAATQVLTPIPTLIPIQTPTQAPLTLKDGLNRSVTLAGIPQKIISMAPSNTELLYAVGAGPQMIARDEFSDYPAEAKALPSIGGSMGKYDMEKIASLQPDLVLASELNTPDQVKALEALKLTVYYLSNPTDLDGLYANLDIVAQLTGHTSVAQKLNAVLKQRVQVVVAAAAKASSKPKVFYEMDGTDPAKPWTAGPGSFLDTMIKMVGAENVAAGLKGDYAQISQEELIAANPDVILLGDAAYGVSPDQVAKRPGWEEIAAVKNNKMFTFDDNTASRPGPRLVDGLEALYKILYP